MEVILCDISAWEYWRTPPAIRDVEIPRDVALAPEPIGLGYDESFACPSSRARTPEQLVRPRLLTDLKGLSLPIHVMTESSLRHTSDFVIAHRIPPNFSYEQTVDLGGGVGVVSAELSLVRPRQNLDPVSLAQNMFEACGLFACPAKTKACGFVLRKLLEQTDSSVAPSKQRLRSASAYYEEGGAPCSLVDTFGNPLPWTLALTKNNKPTSLWKRPPLTSRDSLTIAAQPFIGARYSRPIFDALSYVHNGSGSPLETKAFMMLATDIWHGGEGWPAPFLNRKINFNQATQAIAHQTYCVADLLWPELYSIIEIDSELFHTDRHGFKQETGRQAALESMGYAIANLTYEHLSDLERYDLIIPAYAKKLGLPLQKRTGAFLRRRNQFHSELFRNH